jgi:hypothetical protein
VSVTVNCCCRINDVGAVTPTQPLDDRQCQEVAHLLSEYDATTLSDADLKPLNMLATRVIRALVNEGDSGLDQAEHKKIHAISEAPVATSLQVSLSALPVFRLSSASTWPQTHCFSASLSSAAVRVGLH